MNSMLFCKKKEYAVYKNRFLTSLFMFITILYMPLQSALGAGGFGGPGGALLPTPTEEDIAEIERILSTLSPEEIRQLEELGEELMKTAEAEGVPLFGPPASSPAPAPTQKKETKPKAKKVETKKETKAFDVKDNGSTQDIRKKLFALIEVIDAIRKKISTNPELEDLFETVERDLNNFLYYLYVINDDKIAGKLKDTAVYKLLIEVAQNLDRLNGLFDVTDIDVTQEKNIKQTLHSITFAKDTLKEIITVFKKAFELDRINNQLIAFIKDYEPKALKIKEELEKQEKEAEKYSTSLPVTNVQNRNQRYPWSPGRGATPNSKNKQNVTSVKRGTPTTQAPSQLQTAKQTPSFGANKKDTNSKPKKPVGHSELYKLETEIINKLKKVETIISQNSLSLDNFYLNYLLNKNENRQIASVLGELNFSMKKLKKVIQKWYNNATDNSESNTIFMSKTKRLREFYHSSNTYYLSKLYESMKKITNGGANLEGASKKLYDFIADIEKKIEGKV